MTHAEKLLAAVDERLSGSVELTLYGRAALHLGFPGLPPEYALSRDVDAVLLSKLMRDDPIDRADAQLIVKTAPLSSEQIHLAIQSARVPAVPEIAEQFERCSKRFL